MRCTRVSFDLRPQYFYEHHEGTLSSMAFTPRKYDVIEAYRHNWELVHDRFPELMELADFRLYWAHFDVLDSMLMPNAQVDTEKRTEIVGFLRSHCNDILANRYVGRNRKLAMRALAVSLPLYKLFSQAHINSRRYK